MMQFFQWYSSADGTLWEELAGKARELKESGFTGIWIPPCSKAMGGGNDVGYSTYDLFDWGEFDQQGGVRTKYGTKAQLLSAIRTAQETGLQVYADVVLNHKQGADDVEEAPAHEVDCDNRLQDESDVYPIKAWTHFHFPGRKKKYSTMEWHWRHFNAVGRNEATGDDSHIFLFDGKGFAQDVCAEYGNGDYLIGADVDHSHEEVRGELMYWGRWMIDNGNFDGFRLDAVKHISTRFYVDWLNHLRTHFGDRELFSVGEYWSGNVDELKAYLKASEGVMSLFDAPLHFHFCEASKAGGNYDLSKIFEKTLTQENPSKAVTFVENHDTQPGQSLESPVEPWFKPIAYALILLRKDGYPCVFYADYYGAEYDNPRENQPPVKMYSHRVLIDAFLKARHAFGYGEQEDYFDHPNCLGWTRLGSEEHPGAMAIVLSGGDAGFKRMNVHRPGAKFTDIASHFKEEITIGDDGWADFPCPAGNVSVWVQK